MRNRFVDELLSNKMLWSALCAWTLAQLIKILFDWKNTGKFKLSLLVSSGGMPSSHSAIMTAMTTAIGFQDGFDSTLFALSTVVSMVVMYDAAGVRRAAGNQAAAINILFKNLETQGIKLDKTLKELLGHSPVEVVAGAVLGVLVTILIGV